MKPDVVATAQTGTFEFATSWPPCTTRSYRAWSGAAWREFVDAVAAVMRSEKRLAAAGAPTARLKARERDHSERIVAIRALDLALSRLGAVLNETQRRSLSDASRHCSTRCNNLVVVGSRTDVPRYTDAGR